jgi:phosphoglycolate phosphatase
VLRALLLDLDGTLVDTPQAIVEVAQSALAALGLPAADPRAVKDTIGLPLPVALGQLIGTGPVGAADAVEIYRKLWRTHVTPRIPQLLYPGVREGLEELKRAGFRLAVVTGKAQDGADSTVAAAGLRDVFDVVLGYTSVPNPKPAPDIALLALDRVGVGAGDAVIVGDSIHDLEMARRAGIRSIAVTYGAQPETLLRSAAPTWVAHSFPEVVRIALRLATLGSP